MKKENGGSQSLKEKAFATGTLSTFFFLSYYHFSFMFGKNYTYEFVTFCC